MNALPAQLAAANHVHHFEMGIWLLFLAYIVSVIGSVVGLACTRRSSDAVVEKDRLRWLAMAAVAIGGVAIWLMHFIAMLGFAVPGSVIRYDLGWTFASAVISIVATFAGLVTIGRTVDFKRLLAGGIIMGLAVNLMHYTGMWAVQLQGEITYNKTLVGLSILIAVVAATVALWFTLVLESLALRIVAGFVMGVAVVGMHFTGMAAVSVDLESGKAVPGGLEVFSFLFPVFVIGLLALAIPITAVMMSPDRGAVALEAEADQLAADAAAARDEDLVAVVPAHSQAARNRAAFTLPTSV
ncbi:MHYT domain-containing protein [Antrihabitans sp. YC2-6]|uniref:MHYT domain-containing protein n=1 Tax=Antrihabitans sp. YC2-6 TaxID=2799498 RepID=UPI0018F4FDCE|nr:MHYT domain-containing protein [Antrihabitans sp. YC2-6]MBJ8345926.1 signal protein [Antrihabitans sp. YC2-6]